MSLVSLSVFIDFLKRKGSYSWKTIFNNLNVSTFRYIAWILVAALYHLPSFLSMGVDMRMNLSLFLSIYISSILFLLVFHIIFIGLWYIGLVARVAGRRPAILTILQNCAVSPNIYPF